MVEEKDTREWKYRLEERIRLPEENMASMVTNALKVEQELNPRIVFRQVHQEGNEVVIILRSKSAKYLRTSSYAFHDFIILAIRTLNCSFE
mmetsp:Transcript_3595/g.9807  ORF Transcript_3595/g.9807 Transcript_3595/m.9807 type:complete len:91 (+) Transcript_3595:277-549(+)